MINVDYITVQQTLLDLVKLKKIAVDRLAQNMGLKPEEIFYKFMKGGLPEKGIFEDGTLYYFHGLGCSVKNDKESWKVELEFGPHGTFHAFDKYTLCHLLGFTIAECDNVISQLVGRNMIKLADENLFMVARKKPNKKKWVSEEEEIDASVADRYVVITK